MHRNISNKRHQALFDSFLEDFTHFINQNAHQLQIIEKVLTATHQLDGAKVMKCVFTARHDTNDNETILDPIFNFYKETMYHRVKNRE